MYGSLEHPAPTDRNHSANEASLVLQRVFKDGSHEARICGAQCHSDPDLLVARHDDRRHQTVPSDPSQPQTDGPERRQDEQLKRGPAAQKYTALP